MGLHVAAVDGCGGGVNFLDGLLKGDLYQDWDFSPFALVYGPTIKARRGRQVNITQRNRGGRELNVHLHGGVTEPQFDGHPHSAIPNGEDRLYEYPNVARSASSVTG